MIDAIETLRRAVERARPRPGRLRGLGAGLSALVVAALALFWLPGALIDHTVSVVPQVKRVAIGEALMSRIERLSGPACADPGGQRALAQLARTLGTGPIYILPGGVSTSLHVPGQRILLNRALVENYEEPDVAAGYALAEATIRAEADPLRAMLRHMGLFASFRLLTTGELPSDTLDAYAEDLLKAPRPVPEPEPLLARFDASNLRSRPYAYARDATGESVLQLIEGDPMAGKTPEPLLSDGNWLRLQAICGS